MVGTVYDLYHMIIPNEIPIVLTVLALALLVHEHIESPTLEAIGIPLFSASVAAAFYGLLWVISRGQWIGLGDAKLAFPLGLVLQPLEVFSMLIFSFWIGALIAVSLLGLQALRRALRARRYPTSDVANQPKYLTMKSEIPFAPFLVAAFVLVYFGGGDVLSLTDYVISSIVPF